MKTEFFDQGDIAILGWRLGEKQIYISAKSAESIIEDEPQLIAHTTVCPGAIIFVVRRDCVKFGFPIEEESVAKFTLADAGELANEWCENIRNA